MKRKLFIGSSSEGKRIAENLKEKIETENGDWIECDIWNEGKVFELNTSALDALIKASRKYDYGILVATKDDLLKSRGFNHFVPRDNVMFEMGMFLGSLGLTRAFLLVEKQSKLPTDYNGITVPYYDDEIEGSLEKAIESIQSAISNSRNTFNLKPVPSAALALGYFESLVQNIAKKRLEQGKDFKLTILLPGNISDIRMEASNHRIQNPTEEIAIVDGQKRPSITKYIGIEENYWDIPTTLQTLNNLMNLIIPSTEIGISIEKKDWIDNELRNFKGTLEMLIKNCPACDGRVFVQNLS
jgi:hypothetical protein